MKSEARARSYAHLLAVALAHGGVRFENRKPAQAPTDITTSSFNAAERKRARRAEKRLREWNGKR